MIRLYPICIVKKLILYQIYVNEEGKAENSAIVKRSEVLYDVAPSRFKSTSDNTLSSTFHLIEHTSLWFHFSHVP